MVRFLCKHKQFTGDCTDDMKNARFQKPVYHFHPPGIPPEKWCDFRIDFESGMTLKQIAEKYFCDQRTVRNCIIMNKSSYDLGKQYAPTKLQPYEEQIQTLYAQYTSEDHPGITRISRLITETISQSGYRGSERTVRNYLKKYLDRSASINHSECQHKSTD